jgi:hypothetical protein
MFYKNICPGIFFIHNDFYRCLITTPWRHMVAWRLNILMSCLGVLKHRTMNASRFTGVWLQKGYGLVEWIYWIFVYTTRNYALQITDTQTSIFSRLQRPLAVSWQLLLPREILQLPALRSSRHSCPCRTLLSTDNSTNWLQVGGHFTPPY